MKRILLSLIAVNMLALVVTFAVGCVSKLTDSAALGGSIYLAHYFLGLLTVILGPLLVHCLVFVYFLGTGRWVKEVALAYKIADKPWPKRTRELKRRTFPVALTAMLVSIATAAAGLGAQMHHWPWLVHFVLALATLAVNVWAFTVEYRNVRTNGEIIDSVFVEVDRLRAAAGLPTNAEALAAESASYDDYDVQERG